MSIQKNVPVGQNFQCQCLPIGHDHNKAIWHNGKRKGALGSLWWLRKSITTKKTKDMTTISHQHKVVIKFFFFCFWNGLSLYLTTKI